MSYPACCVTEVTVKTQPTLAAFFCLRCKHLQIKERWWSLLSRLNFWKCLPMPFVAILGDACIAISMGSQSFPVHVSLLFQKGGVLLEWHRQFKKLLWFLYSWSSLVLSNYHLLMRFMLSCEEMNIDENSTVEIPSFISLEVYCLLLFTRMSDEVQGSLVGFWLKSLKSTGSISGIWVNLDRWRQAADKV